LTARTLSVDVYIYEALSDTLITKRRGNVFTTREAPWKCFGGIYLYICLSTLFSMQRDNFRKH